MFGHGGWGNVTVAELMPPEGLSNVVSINAGLVHSLALKTDGTVVAWGVNFRGETVVPAGLTGVIAISGSRSHSAALKRNGTVVVWGHA